MRETRAQQVAEQVRSTAFRTTLIGYTICNMASMWVVVVLAFFVSYPGGGDGDLTARLAAHLQDMFLDVDGVITFGVYSLVSIGVHVAFWRSLVRNAPELAPFTVRHVAYAVALHVALFVGAHALALLVVLHP